jgi:hypothetical protein
VLDGGLRTGDLAILGGKSGLGQDRDVAAVGAGTPPPTGIPTVVASLEHDPSDVLERLLLIQVGAETAGRTYRSAGRP